MVALITQRSVVQIHPPQPTLSKHPLGDIAACKICPVCLLLLPKVFAEFVFYTLLLETTGPAPASDRPDTGSELYHSIKRVEYLTPVPSANIRLSSERNGPL